MKKNILLTLLLVCPMFIVSAQDGESANTGTFTDLRDEHAYQWIRIGNQTWMAQNLAWLPSVSPSTRHSNSGAYFVYGYEGSDTTEARTSPNYATYGVLYNWEAAKTACPAGWHLPKDAEWDALTGYLGGNAGGSLKETGTAHWYKPNTKATNESGFTALPGGYRSNDGGFESLGQYAYFWSASEYDLLHARGRLMSYGREVASEYSGLKSRGFSVRCLKN